jgi:ABC-2 type transport system ATP-binding protein
MSQVAISIRDLAKRFPQSTSFRDILTFWNNHYTTALDGVDVDVPAGGIFGMLGANGAGKTTLLKILAGLIVADRGTLTVAGHNLTQSPQSLKGFVTYVPGEERSMYWRLTGRENLQLFAVLYDVPRQQVTRRVAEVLEVVGLSEAADRRVATYSTGMKQRLSIARGLLADTEIMLLDEPTRGLDPVSARQLWAFIQDELVERRGRTIVLATHNMEEAATLCGQVVIMHRGRVRACGSVASMASLVNADKHYRIELATLDSLAMQELSQMTGVLSLEWSPPNGHAHYSLELTLEHPEVLIPQVVKQLAMSGGQVLEVKKVEASLSEAIEALGKEG